MPHNSELVYPLLVSKPDYIICHGLIGELIVPVRLAVIPHIYQIRLPQTLYLAPRHNPSPVHLVPQHSVHHNHRS